VHAWTTIPYSIRRISKILSSNAGVEVEVVALAGPDQDMDECFAISECGMLAGNVAESEWCLRESSMQRDYVRDFPDTVIHVMCV
jgi:hypothetical protein